jgi:amidase
VERLNPAINAVVALDESAALACARDADKRLANGEDNAPLLGLPMTVKDTYQTAGLVTTCGIPPLADFVPQEDAVAVARLRSAGAIIFGKTNVPAGGADHQTDNPVYGLTRNPWNTDLTVGGSSGGAAAALAAGLTPLELGSDIGGSIRIPAHFCGLFGHKTSYGAIPTLGHIPPMPGATHEPDLAVAGPMARTAADLELALDCLTTGASDGRPLFPAARHEHLAGFRIAILAGDLPFAADTQTRAALEMVGKALERAGARVSTQARPGLDFADAFDCYIQSLFSIILAGQPLGLDRAMEDALAADAREIYARIAHIDPFDRRLSLRLAEQRAQLRHAWGEFFAQWDAFICPIFPTTAFPHDLSGEGLAAQLFRRRRVDDGEVPYLTQLAWPGLATVAHLPATAFPVPRAQGEMPLGLQIIGPAMEDRTPIRLATLMEKCLGFGSPGCAYAGQSHGTPATGDTAATR